jgi:hypothetical protein
VNSLVVKDEASLALAGDILTSVSGSLKSVEARRAFFVKPIKDHARAIDAFFKRITDPLEDANTELRRKMGAYREVQFRKAEEERLKRDAEAAAAAAEAEELRTKAEKAKGKKAKELEAAAAAAEEKSLVAASQSITAAPSRSVAPGIKARKRWTFEVVEPSKVPRIYLEIDEPAIRRAVMSGVREIAGIRIFETESLAVGGN